MADPANNTYLRVPPPPLPEFYLRTPSSKLSSTSTSESDEGGVCLLPSHHTRRHLPPAGHLSPAPGEECTYRTFAYTTSTNLPPAPPMEPVDDMPPLAVYHICRICVRPRSARYHRDHPIPIDGLPPPPGICRRCRISSVDGSKTIAEVVEVHESGEVKLGIKCLLPDEDYTSVEAMQARRTQRFVDEEDYVDLESAFIPEREGDIIFRRRRASASWDADAGVAYRHIQMTVPPPPPPTLAPAPRTGGVTSHKQARVAMASNAATMGASSPSRLESPKPARPMPVRTASPTDPKRAEVTEAPRRSRSRRKHSTSIVIEAYKPERSETEIRRLARDEVVRYRQAERLMEAHTDAYAHGRLVAVEKATHKPEQPARVPVERRIALVKDVVDRPWIKSPERPRQLEAATVPRREQSQARRIHLEEAYASRRQRVELTSASDRERVEAASAPRHERSQIRREHSRTRRSVDASGRGVILVEERRLSPDKTKASVGEAALRNVSAPPATISSASSDKTPRPDTHASRRAKTSGHASRYEYVEVERHEEAPVEPGKKPARPQDEVKVVHLVQVRHQAHDSDDWTDKDYWLDGQPAQTSARRPSRAAEILRNEPATTPQTRRVKLQRQQMATETLPYPAEESIASVQMPSPKSHVSKSGTSHARNSHDDYVHVERRVTRSSSRPGHDKHFYQKQEVCGQRRKHPQDQPKPEEHLDMRRKDSKLRTSDISSRVHFAKEVEYSPTPPGSEASSSHFRNLGRARAPGGAGAEKGEDLIIEFERRGRARSRLPYEGYDYR